MPGQRNKLVSIVREAVRTAFLDGEEFGVFFAAKDGKRKSRIFPKKNITDMYAKTHRCSESVVRESYTPLPEGMNVALGAIEQRWKDDILDDSSQEEWDTQVDRAIEDLISKINSAIEEVESSLDMGDYS